MRAGKPCKKVSSYTPAQLESGLLLKMLKYVEVM